MTDPREEPAPFGTVVLLTALSAVAVMALDYVLPQQLNTKMLLFGPIALVAFEVVVHEVWWRRWWGAIPGAAAGLAVYFEGRQMVGEPVAYVAAWTLFAVIFCLASRVTLGSSPATPR
ncbi:hypothetical protein [Nonomuraea africana]|uniref:DUF3054 domain-containing protein n=1 Tax=Nonomuraea africana TaxID=46171 RepID=A0ABR9KTM4_9ACTN|nr:hypothetical protein [Nonomuraea africana]MBE1565095.1 hypothetical protein [Nonomuraea africana]